MYKRDSALNKLQWLICRKMKPNLIKDSLTVSPDLCVTPAIILRTLLCLHVELLKAYSHPVRICLRKAVFLYALQKLNAADPQRCGFVVY